MIIIRKINSITVPINQPLICPKLGFRYESSATIDENSKTAVTNVTDKDPPHANKEYPMKFFISFCFLQSNALTLLNVRDKSIHITHAQKNAAKNENCVTKAENHQYSLVKLFFISKKKCHN